MDLSLYVITIEVPSLGRGHEDVARAALEGGATAIQFRDKSLEGAELARAAEPVQALCAEYGASFVINDDAEAATLLRADGLHLGWSDMEGLERWDPVWDAELGLSASSVEEARAAVERGADHLGVGPVFPTPSKDDAAPPMELEGLRAVADAVELPCVAIGGVAEDTVTAVVEAGAVGACVISAVALADDPVDATRRLRVRVDQARSARIGGAVR